MSDTTNPTSDLLSAIGAKAQELRDATQAVKDAKLRVKQLKDEIRNTRKAISAALSTGMKITRKAKAPKPPTGTK